VLPPISLFPQRQAELEENLIAKQKSLLNLAAFAFGARKTAESVSAFYSKLPEWGL
jgi:hypothetical protein